MRLAAQDWEDAANSLDAQGWALLPKLLDPLDLRPDAGSL